MEVFGHSAYELLAATKGIIDFVLLVALIMGGIFLFFVSEQNWKHINVAGVTAGISYLLIFTFGWLIYPVFRVETRAGLLDAKFPQATGLFEIKENIAALGAFIAISLLMLGLFGKMQKATSGRKILYGTLATMLGLLSLTLMTLGFTFTSYF